MLTLIVSERRRTIYQKIMTHRLGEAHFGKAFEDMDAFELHMALGRVDSRLTGENKYWDPFFLQEEKNAILYYLRFLTFQTMKEVYEVYKDKHFSEIRRDCDRLCASARIRMATLENRIQFEGLDFVSDQRRCQQYPNPQCNLSIKREP